MNAPSFSSLRVRLMGLVVLGLLPLLVLAVYTAGAQRKAGAARAKAEALRLARLCATFDERRVDSARQLLVTLAQLPVVRSRDARGCKLIFTRILREHPAYRDIRAGDPEGNIFARGTSVETVDKGRERALLREAIERKDISIKPYELEGEGGSVTMSVAYPVIDENGKPLAVVCAVLDLRWLAAFSAEAQLPEDSVFAVFNSAGVLLARVPAIAGLVGNSITKSEIGKIEQDALSKGNEELAVEAAGYDGVRRLHAFTPSHMGDDGNKESRIYFHVGIPTAAAFSEAKRNLIRQASLLGMLAAVALVSTWIFAGVLVLRPVKSLVTTTKQLAGGDLSARTSLEYRGGELEQLATAFDEMAATLETRTAERKAAEDALRQARDGLEVRVAERTAELAATNEGLQREIAGRKKIQEELHLSKERLELVIHGTNDGIWDWDMKTNEVYFSPRWKSMLGWEDHEIPNRFEEWEKRLHPEDHKRALETLRAYLDGKTPFYELEHRLLHKDGTYRWILARGAALHDAEGRPYRMVGSHVDLTERKQAAEDLKKAAEELARSNKELEQFAYIASHDLQEPLRMVSSYTELLVRRYKEKLDPTAMEFIGYAVDGSRRMSTLISDLLAYSRVNTQRQPDELVDCAEIFRTTLDNLKIVIEETKASVTADALPGVMGDATQLLQLFQNLIGNAIKFHGKKAPRVHVSASRRAGVWLFAVKDNGIGIAKEDFERIFLIFQRLHSREEYPGTGIGLAVCKRIVERHGGRLWVESKQGEETTFFFTIPGRSAESA